MSNGAAQISFSKAKKDRIVWGFFSGRWEKYHHHFIIPQAGDVQALSMPRKDRGRQRFWDFTLSTHRDGAAELQGSASCRNHRPRTSGPRYLPLNHDPWVLPAFRSLNHPHHPRAASGSCDFSFLSPSHGRGCGREVKRAEEEEAWQSSNSI